MNDYIVEYANGVTHTIQAINEEDAAISAERYCAETAQDFGPVVSVQPV